MLSFLMMNNSIAINDDISFLVMNNTAIYIMHNKR